MRAGRPITWTEEKKAKACEKILTELSRTELGLEHICEADESLPHADTFHVWRAKDEELDRRYVRAREIQAEYISDNAGVLAGQLVAKNPVRTIDPAAFRAYLDAQKWRTAKLAPRTHGDKVDITSKGNELKTATIVVATDNDKELLEAV